MWEYTQTMSHNGDVHVTFQKHTEQIAELVTHKAILEQYGPSYVEPVENDKEHSQDDKLDKLPPEIRRGTMA